MKRLTSVLLIVLTVLMLAMPVSANSPPPGYFCSFHFENLPEGTAYVDILIELSEDASVYRTLNENNLPSGVSETSAIASFCEDGYRSYSLHYADASAMMEPEDNYAIIHDKVLIELRSSGELDNIKLAMVDEAGAVLLVSAPHSLAQKSKFLFMELAGDVYYDAKTDSLTVQEQLSTVSILTFLIISIAGLLLTLFVEWEVGWAFGLHKEYSRLILLTNTVSQVLMRIVDILIRGFIGFAYLYVVLVLEVFVYAGEFLVYRKKMKTVSWKRCLLYTITANSASLLIGLWLFKFLLI